MFSKLQIEAIANAVLDGDNIVAKLAGKDLAIAGLTSAGIANTGNIANIGDIATTGKITGGEIVENMTGYTASKKEGVIQSKFTINYCGIVKNGNKLTIALAGEATLTEAYTSNFTLMTFTIPESVGAKLIPFSLEASNVRLAVLAPIASSTLKNYVTFNMWLNKDSDTNINIGANVTNFLPDVRYVFRVEFTFLLSENLVE